MSDTRGKQAQTRTTGTNWVKVGRQGVKSNTIITQQIYSHDNKKCCEGERRRRRKKHTAVRNSAVDLLPTLLTLRHHCQYCSLFVYSCASLPQPCWNVAQPDIIVLYISQQYI